MKKILAALLLTINCYAQNPEWINLTNSFRVFDIISEGNDLWIATFGGLVKLNKTTEELTFYNRANANLPSNQIRGLAIDSSGNMWIGTEYGGVGRFDGFSWQAYNTTNSALPDNQLNTQVEADAEGNIWVGALGYVLKFNGTEWKSYRSGSFASSLLIINDIAFDKDGILWVGASWGLGKLTGDSIIAQSYGGHSVYSIKADSKNNIWVGSSTNGLFKYDGESWTVYDTSNSDIPLTSIYDMKFDQEGTLWLATSSGLVKFDGNNWEIFNTFNSGLTQNEILSIEIDAEGIIWLGLFNGDLIMYDGINWKKYDINNSLLPSNYIYDIEIDNNDYVWISSYQKILMYDRNNWFTFDSLNSELTKSVSAIESDADGNLWFGYIIQPYEKEQWLSKFDGTNWISFDSTNSPLSVTDVFDLEVDANNFLWAGTSNGLIKFDGTWTVFTSFSSSLQNYPVIDVEPDKSGNIWCSFAYTSKVGRYDGNNWEIFDLTETGLPYFSVNCIKADDDGTVWFGGSTLVGYKEEKWIVYDQDDFYSSSRTIYDISTDRDNLWLSTYNGGLIKFDKRDSWTNFNIQNSGIASNSQKVIEIDSYGNKWIGHSGGGISVFREGGVTLTGVDPYSSDILPESPILYQNYPNPFNPVTTLIFSLPGRSEVSIILHDILGNEVKVVASGIFDAGNHQVVLNAEGLASGIYFCRMISDNTDHTIKLVYLK